MHYFSFSIALFYMTSEPVTQEFKILEYAIDL